MSCFMSLDTRETNSKCYVDVYYSNDCSHRLTIVTLVMTTVKCAFFSKVDKIVTFLVPSNLKISKPVSYLNVHTYLFLCMCCIGSSSTQGNHYFNGGTISGAR